MADFKLAATTRFRDPDTGKVLGIPEAVADHKVTAGTRYAPQWKLDGYASEAEAAGGRDTKIGSPTATAAAPVAFVPVAEAHDDELAALLSGQTAPAPVPVVAPESPIPTPAQQRMAKARAARAAKRGA